VAVDCGLGVWKCCSFFVVGKVYYVVVGVGGIGVDIFFWGM